MTRRFSVLLTIIFCFIVCMTETAAQDSSPRVIDRGVLNGSAIQLPKPVYPEASRLEGSGGVVMINVVIGELGHVISAEAIPNKYVANDKAIAGEPLAPTPIDTALIEAAEDAARRAKFAPTLLYGQPVRVKGMITYHFAEPRRTASRSSRGNGRRSSAQPKSSFPSAAGVSGGREGCCGSRLSNRAGIDR